MLGEFGFTGPEALLKGVDSGTAGAHIGSDATAQGVTAFVAEDFVVAAVASHIVAEGGQQACHVNHYLIPSGAKT